MVDKIFVKNDSQISLMAEGGKKLARIKRASKDDSDRNESF